MVEFHDIFTDFYKFEKEGASYTSETLQSVQVPVVARSTCATNYASQRISITSNMVCAGYAAGILSKHFFKKKRKLKY